VFFLGVVPARGGSKQVPAKNLRQMCGKPLIAHTIEAAMASSKLSDVCVSTDNDYIMEISKSYGVKSLIRRPDELATDNASIMPVIRHAIETYEAKNKQVIDAVVVLFPTLPLRTVKDLDGSLETFLAGQPANSLTSVHSVDSRMPYYLCREDSGRLRSIRGHWPQKSNRQDYKPLFLLDGAIEISRREQVFTSTTFQEENPLFYEIPIDHALDIDDEGDWRVVEAIMKTRQGIVQETPLGN
jgi:CMP-N,N'-diacetyllegionaminic acid synthase